MLGYIFPGRIALQKFNLLESTMNVLMMAGNGNEPPKPKPKKSTTPKPKGK